MPEGDARALARELKAAFEALGPMIEAHTARVCPSCASVCCIDRHGTHEPEDIAFLDALGEPPPSDPPLTPDTLPCRHLVADGCSIERWLRPFRCTWYFCRPLLDEMPRTDRRAYRRLVAGLNRLVTARREMLRAVAPCRR